MADPLQALQKAQTIGPWNPLSMSAAAPDSGFPPQHEPILNQMPLTPGGVAGFSGALGNIWSGVRGMLGGAGDIAPQALQGLLRATPGPATETLGETSAEFAPVGGEDMYNVGRPATDAVRSQGGDALSRYAAQPMNAPYGQIKGTGAFQSPVTPPPPSPFQQMSRAGAFSGGRTVRDVGNLQQEAPGGLSDAITALKRQIGVGQ